MTYQPLRVAVACTVLLLSLACRAAVASPSPVPSAAPPGNVTGSAPFASLASPASLTGLASSASPAGSDTDAAAPLSPVFRTLPSPGAPVRLGMSAPFTGSGATLGREFHRGAASCFARVNAGGGVHGRRVEIVALDDGYDPERTVWNVIRLIEEERVFALFGLVGTPTVTRVLPLLGGHPERAVPLLFPFTGARPLSLPRHEGLVFRLRASYDAEFSELVERLSGAGCTRVAVCYQADAYGREGWADLRDALARRRLSLAAEASYPRGAGRDADFTEQAGLILQGMPDAVVCVGTDAACAAFIRDLRDLVASQATGRASGPVSGQPDRPAIPVAMPSFVDSRHLVRLLAEMGRAAQRDYTRDLVLAEVVPPWNADLPAAADYRRDFAEMADAPEVLSAPGGGEPSFQIGVTGTTGATGATGTTGTPGEQAAQAPSPGEISFEGYLAARLVVRALERMGPDPSPAELRAALAGLDGHDLGIGLPYRCTPTQQGVGLVRFTTVHGGVPVDLPDFSEWRR
ncbi:ABC transporter substrate-binding protein [Nitratidesulfovibrio sp. 1201_IL3209]|uniref:ABC transporter substrate-binding protein n=1 Tax=Nitratidesulfovibrio sp. 1201_IL3209 TaxID=3084053 RepID=UPI002FD91BD1